MFRWAELLVFLLFLYFASNLLRYCFFREAKGVRYLFGLSDAWLKDDDKKRPHRKGKV